MFNVITFLEIYVFGPSPNTATLGDGVSTYKLGEDGGWGQRSITGQVNSDFHMHFLMKLEKYKL